MDDGRSAASGVGSGLRFSGDTSIEADTGVRDQYSGEENLSPISSDAVILVEQKAVELAMTVLASEPFVNVFLFGSRATGRAGSKSDFDLGLDLGHPVSPDVLTRIREAFDELPIFQKVDVVDFAALDPTFKAIAGKHTKKVYERKAA